MSSHIISISEPKSTRGEAKLHVDALSNDPALKTVVVSGVVRTRMPPALPQLFGGTVALEAPVDVTIPAPRMQAAPVVIVDFLVTAIQHVNQPCTIALQGQLTLNSKTYSASDSITLNGQGFAAGSLVWKVEETP
jgi:hypothetical protein